MRELHLDPPSSCARSLVPALAHGEVVHRALACFLEHSSFLRVRVVRSPPSVPPRGSTMCFSGSGRRRNPTHVPMVLRRRAPGYAPARRRCNCRHAAEQCKRTDPSIRHFGFSRHRLRARKRLPRQSLFREGRPSEPRGVGTPRNRPNRSKPAARGLPGSALASVACAARPPGSGRR